MNKSEVGGFSTKEAYLAGGKKSMLIDKIDLSADINNFQSMTNLWPAHIVFGVCFDQIGN